MNAGSILTTGIHVMQAGIDRAISAGRQIADRKVESDILAKNLVALKQAEIQAKIAANIVKTGDEMLGTIINIRA